MRHLISILLISTISLASVVDDYLNSLKTEVLKENPNFKGFDEKRGQEIFTSKHIGKKRQRNLLHFMSWNKLKRSK